MGDDDDVFLFETGDRKLLVSKEWQLENLNLSSSAEDNVFYVTVSIVESHGYESTPSTPLIVTLMSKTPTTAYTALAITAGIVFILAISVGPASILIQSTGCADGRTTGMKRIDTNWQRC